MSRILLGASAAAMMLAASALSPVIAQSAPGEAAAGGPASIGTLTCGDITGLSETDASALIYYSAGYQDGLRDSDMSGAMDADNADNASADKAANSAAGGAGDAVADSKTPDAAAPAADNANSSGAAQNDADNENAGGASATPDIAGSGGTMVGGLGLQASTIIDACSRTPDALISEIIASNGGSAGSGGAVSGAPPDASGNGMSSGAGAEAPAGDAPATPK